MSKLKILVADDHPVVRSGLRGLIAVEPDMEVVGEAADGKAAVAAVSASRPDVVVMDVSMPEVSGAEATRRIRTDYPDVRVVALTAHEDRGYLRQLLAAGAGGYVLKRSAASDLVRAIRRVAAGETYLDPAVAGEAAAKLSGTLNGTAQELSDREAEVVQLIARGYSNKEIAVRLEVSVKTIETYKARSMEKLKLRTRVDLVRYALQRGWLADA